MLSEMDVEGQALAEYSDTRAAVGILLDKGLTRREIGEILGVTRNTVAGIIFRHYRDRTQPQNAVIAHEIVPTTRRDTRRHEIALRRVVDDTPAPVPVATPVAVAPTEITPELVAIVLAGPGACRWPMWGDDATVDGMRYCGARSGRNVYCGSHASLAYRPARTRRAA